MSTSAVVVRPKTKAPAPAREKRRRSRHGIVGARRTTLLLTTLPAVMLMLVFVGIPGLQGIRLSFSSWGGVGPVQLTGLENYQQAVGDELRTSLWLTIRFSVLSTAGIIIVSTLLAAAVSAGVKGSAVYRVVWFLPGIAPVTALGIFWTTAFQPHSGAVNFLLGHLGLGDAHAWLASATLSIYPPIFVTIWASVGFAFLLLLGSMEQIPVSVYEAARIDGAGPLRRFWSLTLPLVRPVLTMTAMLELIWTFNGFTILWAMTQGGPGLATSTLPVLIYKEAFQLTHYGFASALAVIGGVILISVGVLSLRLSQSQQNEQA